MEDVNEIIETENNKEQNEFKPKKKKVNIFLIVFLTKTWYYYTT